MTNYFIKRLPDYSKETLIEEIKRVASIITSEKITTTEFNKHSKASALTIQRKFGSWEKALIESGVGNRYGGKNITDKMKNQDGKGIAKETLIEEIKAVVKKLNQETISHKDFNDNSIYSSSVVVKRFGSWHLALKAAGILSSQNRKITESDLFENILTVWTHYGRQPKSSEMNRKPSIISNATYIDKFGGWIKALYAFEIFVNKNQQENEEEKTTTPEIISTQLLRADIELKPEDKHKVPIGLRYQVFVRDRFRCVKCGRSPATELINLTLHADHIIPFSKGGKTVIDNLQTTCSDCNLGKGNRHNE